MTVALLIATLLSGNLGWLSHRKRPLPATAVMDLTTLLGLAVDGGMGLSGALRWSADFVDPALRPGLTSTLHAASQSGLAAALRSADGPTGPLLRSLARPVETGAAIGPVLAGLRDRLESQYLADVQARLERLPVKLVLPLALLMLPGLLLMIVAPALIDALSRLG